MCLLFETIRIENGLPLHTDWHERRISFSRKALWDSDERINLKEIIDLPDELKRGIVRCNVHYSKDYFSVKYSPYTKKPVRTLKLVDCGDLDYSLKFSDRSEIDTLFSQRENCDEIILVRNGLVTDTSISNLIFYDGSGWFTPDIPLLNGTCRQRLLSECVIQETRITVGSLYKYQGLKMINALRSPGEEELIPLSNLRF